MVCTDFGRAPACASIRQLATSLPSTCTVQRAAVAGAAAFLGPGEAQAPRAARRARSDVGLDEHLDSLAVDRATQDLLRHGDLPPDQASRARARRGERAAGEDADAGDGGTRRSRADRSMGLAADSASVAARSMRSGVSGWPLERLLGRGERAPGVGATDASAMRALAQRAVGQRELGRHPDHGDVELAPRRVRQVRCRRFAAPAGHDQLEQAARSGPSTGACGRPVKK